VGLEERIASNSRRASAKVVKGVSYMAGFGGVERGHVTRAHTMLGAQPFGLWG